jgi:hypothetical protein
MSTILGLIFNNEVIIASNIPKLNDENEGSAHACVTGIFVYNLEPQIFYVSLTGKYREIQQFNLKLGAANFVGAHVSADVFVSTCYSILRQLSLSDLRIMAVCFDGGPTLYLVSAKGIERQTGQNSYLIAFPASLPVAGYYLLNKRFACSEFFPTKADALAFIQNVFGHLTDTDICLSGGTGYDYLSISNPFDFENIPAE